MQRSLFSWPGLPGNEPEPQGSHGLPQLQGPQPSRGRCEPPGNTEGRGGDWWVQAGEMGQRTPHQADPSPPRDCLACSGQGPHQAGLPSLKRGERGPGEARALPGEGWVGFWAMFMSCVLCFHTWFLGVPDTHLGPCWVPCFLGLLGAPRNSLPFTQRQEACCPLILVPGSPLQCSWGFSAWLWGPEPSGPNPPCASLSLP